MPNWCENELTITTDTAELMDKILSEIKGENDEFSFEAFLPMPNILRAVVSPPRTGPNGRYMLQKDGGGFEHIEATEEQQAQIDSCAPHTNWYDWSVEHWGTKWNASDVELDRLHVDNTTINFNTAWGPPAPIMTVLREKYPEADFSLFYREDGMRIAGYI